MKVLGLYDKIPTKSRTKAKKKTLIAESRAKAKKKRCIAKSPKVNEKALQRWRETDHSKVKRHVIERKAKRPTAKRGIDESDKYSVITKVSMEQTYKTPRARIILVPMGGQNKRY